MSSAVVDVAQWSAGVGTLMPLLVAVVNRSTWKAWLKGLVAMVACIIAGTVTAILTGGFTAENVGTGVLTVFLAAIVTYRQFWQPSEIAPKIEKATTPSDTSGA